MEWKQLQSRHLNGARYDPLSQTLHIQFVNGAIHAYQGVPQTIADSLFQISSPGSYFHAKIRDRYPEVKVAAGATKSGRKSRRRF